jgi:membrane-bound lytic murein transglycosylase D
MILIIFSVLAALWFFPVGAGAGPGLAVTPPPDAASGTVRFPYFALPSTLYLCGAPVPLQEPAVREALDREFTIVVWSRAQTTMWLKRANRYFPEIDPKLRARRLPMDLRYVVIVESDLRTRARSSAGARGPWQFMGPTAQHFKLRCDKAMDERLKFDAATDAALTYLARLHRLFHDWPLALAAYNAGEGRVQRAIAAQGVHNYYHLSLPAETERYVYRIMAAKIVLEDPARYGFEIPADQLYPPRAFDEVQVTLARPIPVRQLAEASGTYFKAFKTLNPWIKGDTLCPGTFRLKIPAGSTPRFQAAMRQLNPVAPPAPGAGSKK